MDRVADYWHMLPQEKQARRAIWDATNPHTGKRRIDEAFPRDIRDGDANEQLMRIRFVNGSTWRVVASDTYHNLVGAPPAGIVFSEWSRADPEAWGYLSPILEENGGWAVFATTPYGHNHCERTHELAESDPAWFGQRLTVDETDIFTPEQLVRAKAELQALYGEQMGQMMYRQEYYCTFEAMSMGALFSADDLAGIWRYEEEPFVEKVEELEAW